MPTPRSGLTLAITAGLFAPSQARAFDVFNYSAVSRRIAADTTIASSELALTNSTPGSWTAWRFQTSPPLLPTDPLPFDPLQVSTLLSGGGYATQTSNLQPDSISGSFLARAWDGNQGFGGRATSTLTTTFTLTEPATCFLDGTWSFGVGGPPLTPGLSGTSTISLASSSGTLFSTGFSPALPPTSGPISFAAILVPDTYTLVVDTTTQFTSVGSNLGARNAQLDFTFTIPTPGAGGVLLGAGLLALPRRHRRRFS